MLNTLKILIIFSAFSLLTGPTTSFAWDGHGSHGSYRDHGYHGGYKYHGGGWGYNISFWPDNYCYYCGVLVSPPIVEAPVVEDAPGVVEAPVIVTAPTSPATDSPAVDSTDSEITVNVPNVSGGYTAVVIKKSGSGFIGPQGEYYTKFPKISQLSIMYGK